MKLFKDIPFEKYDDARYCYEYLNAHKTIGDENANYNGIFHIHWRGPVDNNKVILQLKSILATQEVEKIFFWIENDLVTLTSPKYINLIQLRKYVDIKVFDKSIFYQATGDPKNKERIWMYYTGLHGDKRYKTDMFRWIILNIYGGVYTDADTLLLRDLREIKINNWSSSWGRANISNCAEGCIIKLEKGSNVYEQMYLNNPNNSQCFLLIQNDLPQAYNFNYENLIFTPLPCAFFDMVWNDYDNNDLEFLTLNNFDHFFQKTDKEINIDNFFKGCFGYHWHGRWNMPEFKDSYAGKLNEHLDKIIEEKYNIKLYKIFQD